MKINSYELEGKLKQQLDAVYVFSGNDPFWLNEATATVQKYAQKAGFDKSCTHCFSDEELNLEDLIETMTSPGLFADRVLVIIKITDFRNKTKSILEACIASLNPSLLLIIQTPRLSQAELKKNTQLTALANSGIISFFYDPTQKQIFDFLRNKAAGYGLNLNNGAIAILFSAYEGNLDGMCQVIQKMELCGIKGQVNEEMMREHISAATSFSVFDYVEAMIDPATPVARRIQIMEVLLANGSTIFDLISRTASVLNTLHEMRSILDSVGNLNEYFAGHRLLKSYTAKRPMYFNAANNNSISELHHLIEQLNKADFLARNFQDEEALMILKEIAITLSAKNLRLYPNDDE